MTSAKREWIFLRLIMGYSAEDALHAGLDFNRVVRLLIGKSRFRAVG